MNKEQKTYKNPFNYKEHAVATPETFLIFLIGDKAREAYCWGQSETWGGIVAKANGIVSPSIGADYKPLILTKDHLSNIANVRLADKNHKNFLFFQCGEVTPLEKENLIHNLATKTNLMRSADNHYYYYVGENSAYKGTEVFTYNDPCENLNENGVFERIASGDDPMAEIIATVNKKLGVAEGVPDGYLTYSDYFNKGLADNQRCSDVLEWYGGNLKKANGGYYQFNGKVWERLDDNGGLSKIVSDFLKAKKVNYSNAMKKNVTSLLGDELGALGKLNPDFMAFKNGVLNKQTGELLPHDKEYCLTSMNDCDYWTSSAPPSTPFFDKVISQASGGDKEKSDFLMAMLFNIAFLPDGFEFFYELSGDGGTGKSTLINIMVMLVGEENTTTVRLRHFTAEHGLTNIIDKRLLISYDEEHIKADFATLKSVVSGEQISINPKGQPLQDYTPKCAFVFASNNPTVFKTVTGGEDKGIKRRLVIVQLNEKIKPEDKIPKLKQKLKLECGGIMWKVLNKFKDNPNHARELIEKQQKSQEAIAVKAKSERLFNFAKCFEVVPWTTDKEIKAQCLKVSCHKATYGYDRFGRNNGARHAIFRAYQHWHECDENTRKPMGKETFMETLSDVFESMGTPITIGEIGHQNYVNLKFKDIPTNTFKEWEN